MTRDPLPITTAIRVLRQWSERHLPIERSALAYDLIILVVHQTLSGTPVSLKETFSSLQYSETGIRKQLNRFIETGQMRLETSPDDSRVRMIIAEPALLDSFARFTEAIREHLGPVLR